MLLVCVYIYKYEYLLFTIYWSLTVMFVGFFLGDVFSIDITYHPLEVHPILYQY